MKKNEGKVKMKKPTLTECRFSDSGRGFGFARLPDDAGEWFIPPGRMQSAMHGDTVLVRRLRRGEDGWRRGEEAAVVSVAVRAHAEVIGTVRAEGAGLVLIPQERRLFCEVALTDGGGARPGELAAARITDYGVRRADGILAVSGEVTAVFGAHKTPAANYAAILHRFGVPTQFSEEALAEAETAAARPLSLLGRRDLRALPTLTIDGAGAKDLDDAISLEKRPDGWRLWVHIADVSEYVRQDGALEREAFARGTSVYFVDKVVPMLPPALSNGSCSLNGGEERAALSAILTLDAAGTLVAWDFCKSVIRSDVRGVYEEVNDLFARGAASPFYEKYAAVAPMLADMHALYEVLRGAAAARGQLELESTEAEILLDADGAPADVLPRLRGDAERMIEQFMLTANVAAARFLHERGLPCLYRIHDEPSPEKIRALALFAHNLGLPSARIAPGLPPSRLGQLLEAADERALGEIVSGVVLRSLAKARYSDKASPHYGLAAPLYCHFTSPIRRYPDLFVHRAISHVLTGSRLPTLPAQRAAAATETEIRAVGAERAIEGLYLARYAAAHLGEEYEATVTGVHLYGVFCRTEKLFEGLIPSEALFGEGARPEYLEERQTLRWGSRAVRLGDRLRVRVSAADVTTGNIDLLPAGDAPARVRPAAAAKSAKTERKAKPSRSGRKSRAPSPKPPRESRKPRVRRRPRRR